MTKNASRHAHGAGEREAPHTNRDTWTARRLRMGNLNGQVLVEFSFPTEDGAINRIVVDAAAVARRPKIMLDGFANHVPVFPSGVANSDMDQIAFIRGLTVDAPIEIVPDKTGFIDADTFATHNEIITADGKRRKIIHPVNDVREGSDSIRGSVHEANVILELANKSTYLAFAVGVALAAPLPTYLKLRSRPSDDLYGNLTETAVFNFSGRSSSGKSSVCLAALSLSGSWERAGSFDFTSRGLAEMAANSNDMLLVVDDTEKAEGSPETLAKALKGIVHTVTGGKSKNISISADHGQLKWSTFGLSSSPQSIGRLAERGRWDMTPGDKVRLLNIAVPRPESGGIFDRIGGDDDERARKSVNLIFKLERAYTRHYGHIFPTWIAYLLAENRSEKIWATVNHFVMEVGAVGQGWEVRFARKFGCVYAAMILGIEDELLPWKRKFAFEVVAKCYYKARRAAKTAHEKAADAASRILFAVDAPGGYVESPKLSRTPVPLVWKRGCVAVRYQKDHRAKLGMLEKDFRKLCKSGRTKRHLAAQLVAAGIMSAGHGHAGTVQARLAIKRNGKIIERPRLWCIDEKKFRRHVKQNAG